MAKYVYSFGGGKADGNESMKNLLGGKGANLGEMAGHAKLRLPVPAGFTITTEVCTHYFKHQESYPKELRNQVHKALAQVEKIMEKRFDDSENPLLVSVRSGARQSMPGMMDTVLNVGLNDKTIQGLIKKTQNPRFAYDAYRRLIMMYADVVMEKAAGIKPKDGKGIRKILDERIGEVKKEKGYMSDTDLKTEDLKSLVAEFKSTVKSVLGKAFPERAEDQLWGAIGAVFTSWNGKRAIEYRKIEKIPDSWGTAVNVQSMVFGNMGADCSTGVAFTRNPGNGENQFYGEYLINAQGEDVVAGIRTPSPINEYSKNDQSKDLSTMESRSTDSYKELYDIQSRLERHYKDMQDIEFTIEKGRLFMLQCRIGKRNGIAAVRIAIEMYNEQLIDAKTAVSRVKPDQLTELLLPMLDPESERSTSPIAKGLPAGPGGAGGRVVFSSEDAVEWSSRGEKVILVREETSPEDVDGMHKSQAILTSKGGMTSHAALVARGWGKCCIVGCGDIEFTDNKSFKTKDGQIIHEGDKITLNGTIGVVYKGILPLVDVDLESNQFYGDFMKLVDKKRLLRVRANADTPDDAKRAISFGAEGIGLFRTEHMFYGEGSDEPLFLLRKMIMSKNLEERKAALDQLFPFVKNDIKASMKALNGLPITIRLLDPPLHEFVPHGKEKLAALANDLGIDQNELSKRANNLRENNPMLGHRGVRLGITFPEISEMQIRAILEAAGELVKEGGKAFPEIMIPVTCVSRELEHQKEIVSRIHGEVCQKLGVRKIPHLFGTMIEIPRAALTANKMAETVEFFSFGTNDLTQMGFGFSRDDIGGFLPDYIGAKLLPADPFQTIDQEGIGELIKIGIERGRSTNPRLKVGICGEHGGDPDSVIFCHQLGMDYVSCSPFRIPIARLAAAQAVIIEEDRKKAAAKRSGKSTKRFAIRKAKKAAKKSARKTIKKRAKKRIRETSKKVRRVVKKKVKKSVKKVKKVATKKVKKQHRKKRR